MFAGEVRKRRIQGSNWSNWRWCLDEVFVRINGERHCLWRAVDHEGDVLEAFVTKRRDRRTALKLFKRTMKRHGRPWSIVADRLRSCSAAMKLLGNPGRQECGRWLNNRAENSHLPFLKAEGGDGAVQGHQDSTETHRCAYAGPQSLQPPTPPPPPPPPPQYFQTTPGRRECKGKELLFTQ